MIIIYLLANLNRKIGAIMIWDRYNSKENRIKMKLMDNERGHLERPK